MEYISKTILNGNDIYDGQMEKIKNIHKILRLKHSFSILEALSKSDGLNWTTIAYDVVRNSSSADRTLKRLTTAGLVKKEEGSGRERVYYITGLGEKALEYARKGKEIFQEGEYNGK